MSDSMVKTESPWWAREAKEALKGYGLAVVIVLAGVLFVWQKAGLWLDAKAESERALAVAFSQLVADNQQFQQRVLADHCLQNEKTAIVMEALKTLLEDHRKNDPAATTRPSSSS